MSGKTQINGCSVNLKIPLSRENDCDGTPFIVLVVETGERYDEPTVSVPGATIADPRCVREIEQIRTGIYLAIY
jgi:hypothetical protein